MRSDVLIVAGCALNMLLALWPTSDDDDEER